MWLYAFVVTVCGAGGHCYDEWVDWDLTLDRCQWYLDTHSEPDPASCLRDVWLEPDEY